MISDRAEPPNKSNYLNTLTPSPNLDSELWASHNLGGSGPYRYRTFYRQVLRLSFEKPVVTAYSRLRILIASPDHGYFMISPIHDRHSRIRFQSRWALEDAQEEPTLTLVLHFNHKSPMAVDLFIQTIPMDQRKVHELYSGPLLILSGTSTRLIPFEMWSMQTHFQPSHRYVYIHIAITARSTRAGFPSVDPHIIRRITELCTLGLRFTDSWELHRQIFRLSLVSRQWQAVSHEFYDILFSELVNEKSWLTGAVVFAITNLLVQKPSRGIGLTELPRGHFRVNHPDVDGGRAWDRWMASIRNFYAYLPHLENITTINPLFLLARNELTRLTKVTYLCIDAPKGGDFGHWRPDQTSQYTYNGEEDCIMGVVLSVINGWNGLNEVVLMGDNTHQTSKELEIPDQDASYHLSRLALSQLRVTCKQIHHLVCRPNTEQRLTSLNLDKLKGLSTQHYRMVLHAVAFTLRCLSIRRCEVELDREEELDRELPLDSTIALTHNIQTITVQSEFASNLSIARKINSVDQGTLKSSLFLNEYERTDLNHETDRVGIGIVESVRQSGWDYVAISFRPCMEKMDKETRMQKKPYLVNAREVARSKALEFRTL